MQNFDVNHQPVISWETPWGKQVQIEKNDKYTVKILHINEGESLSQQFHYVKIETMYVLEGNGFMNLINPDTKIEVELLLKPGDFLTIHPLTIHRLRARTSMKVLEASAGEESDIVRIRDEYGRVDGISDK